MIRFLKHTQLDKQLWDERIMQAPNGLPYALSWYLDLISPGWHALVMDDYKLIMPLTHRRKYGLSYIFLPLNARFLGVFGNNITADLADDFLRAIPRKFLVAEIRMNMQNRPVAPGSKIIWRNNHILDIAKSYTEIRNAYSRNCTRNIKKAVQAGLAPDDKLNPEKFIKFLQKNLKLQVDELTDSELSILSHLVESSIAKQVGELTSVVNKNQELVAVGFYLLFKNRVSFVVCASNAEGKKQQAMYLLVDHQIKKYAGKYDIYDFTGSDMKGVAYFNSSFGAIPEKYALIQINRLKFWNAH